MRLIRVATDGTGTYGVLVDNNRPLCVTLEPEVPIIEPGMYECHRAWFNKDGYEVFEIDVPGHSYVYFHIGNTIKDTEGCVLLATEFIPPELGGGVMYSRIAYNRFMSHLAGLQTFDLVVERAPS